jgi:hypothetical protein
MVVHFRTEKQAGPKSDSNLIFTFKELPISKKYFDSVKLRRNAAY